MPSPKVASLEKKLQSIDSKLDSVSKGRNSNTPSKESVLGAPHVRKGENTMGSRGFQFQRLFGLLGKSLQPEHCTVELDVINRLREKNLSETGWNPAPGAVQAPFATEFMGGAIDDNFRHEMKSLCQSGTGNFDPDEAKWISRKVYGQKANQSWLDESAGGALVAPPDFGELIQLLRNTDAVINAGARVVPLPPSGRIKYPRQTSATTGYYVGENSSITSSNFGTGSLILSAKKVACLVTMPNELIRFASPASEALLRADMTKTLSLTMDKGLLEGVGSDNTPLGILLTPGISTVTPSKVDTNGNTLAVQDLYKFVSAVEEANGEFTGWVLRPQMFWNFVQFRAGVYNGSGISNYGGFAMDQWRTLGEGFGKMLAGFKATTSNQVSISRVKAGGTDLTYVIGADWSNYILAMFGSIEFAQADQGDSAFANDQTVVRAILTHDGACRNPGVFAVADQLTRTVADIA